MGNPARCLGNPARCLGNPARCLGNSYLALWRPEGQVLWRLEGQGQGTDFENGLLYRYQEKICYFGYFWMLGIFETICLCGPGYTNLKIGSLSLSLWSPQYSHLALPYTIFARTYRIMFRKKLVSRQSRGANPTWLEISVHAYFQIQNGIVNSSTEVTSKMRSTETFCSTPCRCARRLILPLSPRGNT